MGYLFLISLLLVLFEDLTQANAHFLESVSGEVHAGNFTYFTLIYPGLVSLELISETGDCDIYVSQFETKPTFDPSSYCLQSSTCGPDTIIVPKSFKRPLSIGIYGHPSHEVSTYTLNIYQISDTSDADDELDELYIMTKHGNINQETGQPFYEESSKQHPSPFAVRFFSNFLHYILLVYQSLHDWTQSLPGEIIEFLFEVFLLL